MRVAVRNDSGALKWLLADHLGSTSVALAEDGVLGGRQLYDAWGSVRFVDGDIATDYTYTGQFSEDYITDGLASQGFDLYFMGWRHYDPELGRFIQPDTLLPDRLPIFFTLFMNGFPISVRDFNSCTKAE